MEKARVQEGRYPIDLPTVLRLAGANNLDIAFVREKVHEAYARSQLAEERFWPTVVPGYLYRRHEGLTQGTEGNFVDVDKQQMFAGVGARVRWELGDAIFSTLSASQRYEGSRSFLEATEQSIILEAAQAYYDLVRENLRARVSEQSAAVSEKLAAELDASFQAGRAFEGDVLRARVQHATGRLEILRSREAIKLASLRLGSLLRLAPGIDLYPVDVVPQPLQVVDPAAKDADLLQEAWERRPEIQEGLAELSASRHDRAGATWGPLIPDVQVEAVPGQLGPVASDLENTEDYAFFLGWRIGAGGLFDIGRHHLADARVRQAEINLERIRQRVADEVLSSLAQLRAKDEQRKLAEQAVKDAERALDLNQQRQARNIGLPLEVLHAEEALTRARLDHYTAVVEYNQAQLRAFASIGRKH
ncbi:MAG: TolC family protein [Planctomycetes bacterium]|nr:TolC family protein [Planctomycetota bacterium]